MTLGGSSQSESLMLAYNKRKAQLDRWKESDTERESLEIRNRPKRVKFADKCIFQAACAANDKAQVAKMIREGYDINAVDEDGITALHQACIEDNLEMVEFLLQHGADVNISDNEGWTPLHAVATCCYVSIAKVLLEHGANVVALNNDCSIPLDICKSEEIREIFIQDINAKGIDLKEARRGEELKMASDAKNWLANGYSEDPHPLTGATALHVAACKGYIKILDQIIKAGADVNVKDFDGWTPLHAAAHWGQKEACEILLENSCDTTIKDNCDQTALDVADRSVLPVFELHKRKRDINKNLEKSAAAAAVTSVGPVIQIQSFKRPLEKEKVQKEEINKTPGVVSNKNSETSNLVVSTGEKRNASDQVEKPKPASSSTGVTPPAQVHSSSSAVQEPTPSTVNSLSTSGKVSVEEGKGDDNQPSWRRTNSLRSKANAPSEEPKIDEKAPARKAKGDLISASDNSLRRAYSFESDPKFYAKLRDARNRIRATNSSSLSTNTAILEHIPTTITNDLVSNANTSNYQPNEVLSRSNCNHPKPLTTSKLQEGFEESVLTRFTQNRNKDSDTSNTGVSGSPSLPNRGSQQDVKVRRSFVPPTRDEESETQRKAHAKRVRETRRSTQGVTLEELKSAEQYVKNSLLGNASDQPAAPPQITVPAPNPPTTRKDEEPNVERRPSWRLRVDEQDPSKFSLEDTRSLPPPTKNTGSDNSAHRSSSLRSRTHSNKIDSTIYGKPPKPPDGEPAKSPEEEKEKDMKNSGAQGAILRKKKTKRRSTGIVQYNQEGTEPTSAISGSDAEVGSGPSSDLEPTQDSKNENGVSGSINYKKLYEEVLKENQLLKGRLGKAEEDVADLKVKLERISITPRITSDDVDKKEKKALERKLSEMEEELKESRHLRSENQKLRDENGALIRVISKLSK